jgi:hypothetical protein
MASKALKAAAVAVVVGVAAYWYWSPLMAIHTMRSAAERKDADAFNDHVDYPKLRESFKGQLSALMAEKMSESSKSGSDMERAGAALGSMLGMAMVDRLVDAMVRPELVMRAMQEAKVNPLPKPAAASSSQKADVKWTLDRKGVDKLVAYGLDPAQQDDKRVGFVFERTGFANWKLTEIRLPAVQ